jgi:phosphotriesterase-related protein
MIGWPGWEADSAARQPTRTDSFKLCVDRVEELKSLGLQTLLDPCPIDLGRNVEFAAEVAQRTSINLVCATGLYKEDLGASAYFRFRSGFQDCTGEMAEIFEGEIRDGIGKTGIRAGVIKVATGEGRITAYEECVLRAAARAHRATGVPLTTHTEHGSMGPEQLDVFADEGVDLRHVIVGHSCGNSDLRYHVAMLDRGCYLGFDRFGLEILQPDRLRKAALAGLVAIGFDHRIVLSHDSVWCWLGRPLPRNVGTLDHWVPTYVFREIVPWLQQAGVTQEKIDNLLVHNPRRYFEGSD